MKERRKYQRIASQLEVKYTIMNKGIIDVPAASENISQSGVSVMLKDTFSIGTRLLLEISLPDQLNPVLVSGDVVWQKKVPGQPVLYATGIEYVKIAEEDASRLSRYVAETLEQVPQDTPDSKNALFGFLKKILGCFKKPD